MKELLAIWIIIGVMVYTSYVNNSDMEIECSPKVEYRF